MFPIARCTLAAASIICTLGGCQDARGPLSPTPPGSKPSMSSVAAPAALRLLVVFTGDQAPSDFADRVAALGGVVDTIFKDVGFAVASGLTAAAAQELRSAPGVRAVEPDLIVGAEAADESVAADLAGADATEVAIESSDAPTGAAFYTRQWNLRAIGADVAWAAGLLGESSVRVAILDTGIDYLHDDLVGRVDLSRSTSLLHLSQSCPTTDPGQPSGNEDEEVRSPFPGRELFTDLHSHGTGVAALISSNARWLAGVTQRTTLFSVKVHDRFRRNCVSVYLAGMIYAADQGADVIHLSIPLEFNKDSFPGIVGAVNRVANYVHRKGAVMVAAAGNDTADLDHDGTRFKFCNAVHVICVAATGPTSAAGLDGPWVNVDAVASYTAFGRSTIDVAGPGGTVAVVAGTKMTPTPRSKCGWSVRGQPCSRGHRRNPVGMARRSGRAQERASARRSRPAWRPSWSAGWAAGTRTRSRPRSSSRPMIWGSREPTRITAGVGSMLGARSAWSIGRGRSSS